MDGGMATLDPSFVILESQRPLESGIGLAGVPSQLGGLDLCISSTLLSSTFPTCCLLSDGSHSNARDVDAVFNEGFIENNVFSCDILSHTVFENSPVVETLSERIHKSEYPMHVCVATQMEKSALLCLTTTPPYSPRHSTEGEIPSVESVVDTVQGTESFNDCSGSNPGMKGMLPDKGQGGLHPPTSMKVKLE
jgi:hypothetical protein